MTEKEVIERKFYNVNNLPPKPVFCSKNPSKVKISPLDAKSPQEVLEQHGMYRDESVYSKNPEKFYADLSSLGDYESNLNAVRSMEEKFNALDVDVRARFNHSVSNFVNYVNSKDFKIEQVLTPKELEKVNKYNQERKERAEFEKYKNSKEYKDGLAELATRRAYEEAKYEEWKAQNMSKK